MIWKAIRKIILIIMIDYRFLCEYSFNVCICLNKNHVSRIINLPRKSSSCQYDHIYIGKKDSNMSCMTH